MHTERRYMIIRLHTFAAFRALFVILCGICPATPLVAKQNPPQPFQNPVLWEDLADSDVLRIGNAYYYSASNMHYSPGAPILRSFDLVHWHYVGHSVPVLDFGPNYDMQGGNAYVRGTWASFLGYRKSNKTFYWGGCIDLSKTYIYSAAAAEGPWKRSAVLDMCYYDAGLLIDDDDTMYVAYGNTKLRVAQLSPDGRHEVKSQEVFVTPPSPGTLEGSRFYKINGSYYIFTDRPPNGEYVLRSTTGPFGPYTMHKLVLDAVSPVPGSGSPHQGGIVQTQRGNWYYMAFIDAYPGGRIPVLAPLKWNKDGWPEVELTDNTWNVTYPMPLPSSSSAKQPQGFADDFHSAVLGPEWEWNHNPDNTKWRTGSGLTLRTTTVTDDLYSARNTLTHRIPGPESSATAILHYARMHDGDCAGLAMLRDSSAWVGVVNDNGTYKVEMKTGLTMDRKWKTTSTGMALESIPVSGGTIWLRTTADIHPGADRQAVFSYSTDGVHYRTIGKPFMLNSEWNFFMGYRFALFNYATRALGGDVHIDSFSISTP